ncbi:Polyamine ABC transporter, periplasmic polyamine-binding protein [Neorhizobium galegae bv. officinalis]|uniref:Polyamine ABC transporter, periplasmic polyamine-binding protein n=1 Tax=Neorhizobium galegae bv. officinalis TaxID=323656 RepID=A0A0T7G0L3_NEOGA|nr:ABC transporter substrate-binding protein [Neorhizobium galegae]CDZ40807.1 Polyamine ABC transporter, periplasmic polyamine-binding protein [Neorhizobium galegae bv. officinalis]CDZ54616.1 Polyamine ABC transporter, periplasmic polyamine-binding protein [Neorhizobium galegae bv. officinalis]
MQNDESAPKGEMGRRNFLRAAAIAMSIPAVARATAAYAQEKLAGSGEVIVFTYGGSFTQGVRKAVFEPFTKATGIKVVDVTADFAEPQVKAMNSAGRVDWDTSFTQAQNYSDMHAAGMFVPVDYSLWDKESIEGTPETARLSDAVVLYGSAMLLAYDERVFGDKGPQGWADFWDVKNFPGPRGLYAPAAKHNLEFALMADGVAKTEIWPLTDDKIDRAFKKLDEIRPHVTKWWSAGGEAPQLLQNREYVMSNAFDGRVISAINQGAKIRMVWEGAHVNYTYWTILKGGPNNANAQKLIAFVNRAMIAAGFTQAGGYPGPNTNQLSNLPQQLVPLLSIAPENSQKVVIEDSNWLAAKRSDGKSNLEHVQERWVAWRAK